jgi:hypothetical protein
VDAQLRGVAVGRQVIPVCGKPVPRVVARRHEDYTAGGEALDGGGYCSVRHTAGDIPEIWW